MILLLSAQLIFIIRTISILIRIFPLKKAKSPDEDKTLLLALSDFKLRHPDITPDIFLGDTSFDTIEICKSLFEDSNFKKILFL